MSALSLREFQAFEAAGQKFLYLVASAAVFALNDCSSAVLERLRHGACDAATIVRALSSRFDVAEVTDTIADLRRVRAIGDSGAGASPKILPLTPVRCRHSS
jgi:hypothetical protein